MQLPQRCLLRLARADGATATEYAIVAFLIGVAVIVSVATVGDRVVNLFEGVQGAIEEMLSGS